MTMAVPCTLIRLGPELALPIPRRGCSDRRVSLAASPQLPLRRARIGKNPVNLAGDERCSIVAVPGAESEPFCLFCVLIGCASCAQPRQSRGEASASV
jgi:hypothetical protein